jgi:hypothetical protein
MSDYVTMDIGCQNETNRYSAGLLRRHESGESLQSLDLEDGSKRLVCLSPF